jgi:hypothetical protein
VIPCLTPGLLTLGRGCSRGRKRDTNSPNAVGSVRFFSETLGNLWPSRGSSAQPLPYCTPCWRTAEVLGAKLAPPRNVAVMLCVPTVNVEMTNVT